MINLKVETFFKYNEISEAKNRTRINAVNVDGNADLMIKNNLTRTLIRFNLPDQFQPVFYNSGLLQGFFGRCLKKMEVAIDRK